MIIPALENLKNNNIIKDYKLVILSEDQDIIKEHKNDSTEQLCITLNNGKIIQIDSFCSGSGLNSSLFVDVL